MSDEDCILIVTLCTVVRRVRLHDSDDSTIEDLAISRIEQTCLGILIFLVVANVVFPTRAKQAVGDSTEGACGCIYK